MEPLEELARQFKDFKRESTKQLKELGKKIDELMESQKSLLELLQMKRAVPPVEQEAAPVEVAEEPSTFLAYCPECFERRPVLDPAQVRLADGSLATQGTCSVCGTRIFRMAEMTGVLISEAASSQPRLQERVARKKSG